MKIFAVDVLTEIRNQEYPTYGYHKDLTDNSGRASVFLDFINKRLKVLEYEAKDVGQLAGVIGYKARAQSFGKIIWPVRAKEMAQLGTKAYRQEAYFPHYYRGEDAWFLSLFLEPSRSLSSLSVQENELLRDSLACRQSPGRPLPQEFELRSASKLDIPKLCELYRNTFNSYPSPITEEAYVREKMGHTAFFKVVYRGNRLVSAASAEIDWVNLNAEITDCATLPEFQGLGLMRRQIEALEFKLTGMKIANSFSLARARSFGMNAVLARLGYKYRGRLINNCHMNGGLEDMNLWVKQLQ